MDDVNGGTVLEFRLLGALEVRLDGTLVAVRGSRQRALLAALLLHPNSPAGIDHLTAAMWAKPPVAPDSNIRTHVAGLRRIFRELGEADSRLATCSGGYVLTVKPSESDLAAFQDLARRGDETARRRDFATAAEHLRSALRLWRGFPLAGQSMGPLVQAEVARLVDLRLKVAEQYAHAQIELGRPEVVVDDLRALVAEHPLREGLWAQLILVLHHCGRQAEALACFAQARHHLVTELGVEPGERLRQVQREVLAGESSGTRPDGSTEVSAWRQLPMDISEFTGRTAELRTLLALADTKNPDHRTAVVISAIAGMAGVGKTRLAVHAAHQLASRGQFDEIQLWTDLRGFDPAQVPADPGAVLESFLRLLGVPGHHIPHDLESRAALYRDRLAGRRALVLLDNAATEEQVRPLLPGVAGSFVLITSRRNLSTLDGVRGLTLDVLPAGEAVALLAHITGDGRVQADTESAERVVDLCGRLPIAISHAGRYLRTRPAWTVRDLAERVERTGQRLEQLVPHKPGVRALFDLSYQALRPDRQRMFRLLGLHPGEDMTAESAAALSCSTPDHAESLLEALLDEHLLQQATAGRYRFHDLMRPYAHDRAMAHETPVKQREALRGLVTWYLHAAESARGRTDPNRARIFDLHPLPAGRTVPEFADCDAALTWYESERANLRAAVRTAAECGLPEVAWQLPWVLLSFYYRSSHWDDWIITYRIGLAAARAAGERRGEGIMWRGLGVAHSDLRQYPTAITCHAQAQAILEEVGDRNGQAWNLNNTGVIHVDLDELPMAADCFRRALPLFHETGDQHGEAICLNNLGDTFRRLGNPLHAIDHLEQALAIQQRFDDKAGLQFTLSCLGDVHHDARQYEDALALYRQAVATSHALGDKRTTARALANLARTLDTIGRTKDAHDHRRRALVIFDQLGDTQAQSIRSELSGE